MFQIIYGCSLLLAVASRLTPLETNGRSANPDIDFSQFENNSISDLKKYAYDHTIENNAVQRPNCSDYVLENEYILLENRSLLLPGSNEVYDVDSFYLKDGTAVLCSKDVSGTTLKPAYDFSDEFLACGHLLIDPHEFTLLDNGTIYIPMYSRTYGPRDYYLQDKGVYICIPVFEEMNRNGTDNETIYENVSKFSDAFNYVTYVGMIVSIISLLSHLIVFCIIPSVRNLPGYCLASLSLSLLLAYCCFFSVTLFEVDSYCAEIGMCIYYFFLTSFFWMNAIAFDVWRSFRVVMKELRIASNRVPWRRFLCYSIYSWMTPGALTVLVKVVDSSDILPEDLRPSFGEAFCWFGQRKALLVFFAAPLIIVMILNAAFFTDVTCVISRATLKTSQSHEATLKKRFFMFMRLALIMGLTWIVGLFAGYADNEVLWYFFIILNTLQGLFIFVVFSCSSKVRWLFCKKYRNLHKKRYSTSVRTVSQISSGV